MPGNTPDTTFEENETFLTSPNFQDKITDHTQTVSPPKITIPKTVFDYRERLGALGCQIKFDEALLKNLEEITPEKITVKSANGTMEFIRFYPPGYDANSDELLPTIFSVDGTAFTGVCYKTVKILAQFLAYQTKCQVIAVIPLLAPEYKFPHQLFYTYQCFMQIINEAEKYRINLELTSWCGYSSGANFVMAALYLNHRNQANFSNKILTFCHVKKPSENLLARNPVIALVSPLLILDLEKRNKNSSPKPDPLISPEFIEWCIQQYLEKNGQIKLKDARNPLASPGLIDSEKFYREFSALLLLLTGQQDCTYWDTYELYEKVRQFPNVNVKLITGSWGHASYWRESTLIETVANNIAAVFASRKLPPEITINEKPSTITKQQKLPLYQTRRSTSLNFLLFGKTPTKEKTESGKQPLIEEHLHLKNELYA
ncbi:MAG: hypothetical protein Tsb005_19810 [Gammaproteobacteria bacterium]